MLFSQLDQELCLKLREFPSVHRKRYDNKITTWHLHELLFNSLANKNPQYLKYFFPNSAPTQHSEPWNLRVAQGAWDGAEYSEAARGRRCGHIFRNGEATYTCRTCSTDDTCVLCTRCFDSTDHEGHQVYVSTSQGSTGCCDCGDPEAWNRPIHCSIHTKTTPEEQGVSIGSSRHSALPKDLQDSIRTTIARALDYLCDILSCSKDDLKLPKNEQLIREDERLSRLKSRCYQGTDKNEADTEFALVVWNDEKHNLDEVKEQIARACRASKKWGHEKAIEIDKVGRSVITYSENVDELLRKARILGEIKITVSIRSARDTFREQMCGAIIEWLSDIAGCSVKDDNEILIRTVCEEMLNFWRIGSEAFNLQVAKRGIIDHQKSDERLRRMQERNLQRRILEAQNVARRTRVEMQGALPQVILQQNTTAIGQELERAGQANVDDEDEDDADADEEHEEDEDDDIGGSTPAAEDEQDFEEAMDLDEALAAVGDPDDFEATADDPDDEAMVVEEVDLLNVATALGSGLQPGQDSEEHATDDSEEENADGLAAENDPNNLVSSIPRTPKTLVSKGAPTPLYWLETSQDPNPKDKWTLPPWEDFEQRVRMDYFIVYDLRMWKQLRNNLRSLYITTVITVPTFKRVLGLRFAALYTLLAQLYLIADREPDHSIINLSLQMLTTPSITAEIVSRGKFLTKLMAILYTFLTKRQVGPPGAIDPTAMMALDSGVLSNRRIYHFFADMKYLLESRFVQERIRTQYQYLLQFLDFSKLFQGICPNVRAVGEHVEYESDIWHSASIIVRDVARISRQFCESFRSTVDPDPSHICRAIRQAAKATIISSLGAEYERFRQAEMKGPTRFKTVDLSHLDLESRTIVDYSVEREPMSFHHTLHYTLSWLIESWKNMSSDQLKGLLQFSQAQLQMLDSRSSVKVSVPNHESEKYILALFDIPLRVGAWLAQMRSGMWVRNGMTLRHQMSIFRGVGQREVSLQRDIFLLQVGFVVCQPETFLASAVDRFGLTDWLRGFYKCKEGYEDHQQIEVAEDLVHLLIILLSDRNLLHTTGDDPTPDRTIARKDVINVLCFKALTYSELSNRLSEKVQEYEYLPDVLEDVAIYRAPEGLSDSGTLRLKEELYHEIDPYHAFYSKSQREEAENVYRASAAKITGQPKEDIFFEPKLRPIKSGVFTQISAVSQLPLFNQLMKSLLDVIIRSDEFFVMVSITRTEALLQVVLHLILIATLEDTKPEASLRPQPLHSFLDQAIGLTDQTKNSGYLMPRLLKLLKIDKYASSKPRVRFVLRHMQKKRPDTFESMRKGSQFGADLAEIFGALESDADEKAALKKKQALERQAKVMAAFKKQQNDFLQNQDIDWGIEDYGDDDGADMDIGSKGQVWEYPKGTCIFCQEEMKDGQLYGTLALMASSNVHRETDLTDEDYVKEVFSSPTDLDQSADAIRPFGVAGQNLKTVRKGSMSTAVNTQRRVVGRGFPSTHHRPGPVIVSCGHIMHFKCFQTYEDSTARRHGYQVARNHPERREFKEFVCPLCKALGNTFLPIIWRPKPCTIYEVPKSGSFESWLTNEAPFLAQRSREALQSSKPFLNYASETFVPGLAAALPDKSNAGYGLSSAVQASSSRQWQIPSLLGSPEGSILSRFRSHSTPQTSLPPSPMLELLQSYHRLCETMYTNTFSLDVFKVPHIGENSFAGSNQLAKTLGFSIAAVEIAQRGVQSTTSTFVDSIPENTLSHLRVLSETVSSYIALGASQPKAEDALIFEEVRSNSKSQIDVLFGRSSFPSPGPMPIPSTPLFSQDTFVFLTECSVYMVPYHHFKMPFVLRLCYLAEIVKTIFTIISQPDVFLSKSTRPDVFLDGNKDEILEEWQTTAEDEQDFSSFVQHIIEIRNNIGASVGALLDPMDDGRKNNPVFLKNPNERYDFDHRLRIAVGRYALPFVRKVALLHHVRYGVVFSGPTAAAGSNQDELSRLSSALGLPGINEIIRSCLSTDSAGDRLREVCHAWIQDWMAQEQLQRTVPRRQASHERTIELRLPHPCIYELIALPESYDTLHSESTRHRCPNNGREVHNPCLCLFCGAVFCGQSQCWSSATGGKGGCFHHQWECAGNFGMFMVIRTCSVLFMNGKQGSWMVAPYLDKHGETDLGLKRRNQLFLNQKRYDRLFRDVWLNHGVPSAIARKLEAEINNGGWETL